MGLSSALQIGRTALTASQVALQVTGNNFANASTPGYSRQIVSLSPFLDGRQGGYFLGRGVSVTGITRQVDQALLSRTWSGTSSEQYAATASNTLAQVEATLNELTDTDLSSGLGAFFGTWSDLASTPSNDGTRALVIQQGRTLASQFRGLRSDLITLKQQLDGELAASVEQADNLLSQIADLNTSIVQAEGGSSTANGLRDQRDQLVTELSKLVDISVSEQPSGSLDVLVGSTPVVLAGSSRGLELRRDTVGGEVKLSVAVKDDGTQLSVASGSISALLGQRDQTIDKTISRLDGVASQLIFQLNRVHSAGYTKAPLTTITGAQKVAAANIPRSLNDPANTTFNGPSGLPFHASNGGFLVTVTNQTTGASETVRVEVDLDGLDASGAPGYADDSSVQSISASLAGISNLTATVNPDGTLKVDAAQGYSFSFSEDSSGALAVLGVNTFFTGKNAGDIAVRDALHDQPGLLAAGATVAGEPDDSATALAIVGLRDQSNIDLGSQSITSSWGSAAADVGAQAANAANRADATHLVRESLESQRQALSGVSIDEESINLLNFQRQYQGAARFITVVDEMTQTLLSLIQ